MLDPIKPISNGLTFKNIKGGIKTSLVTPDYRVTQLYHGDKMVQTFANADTFTKTYVNTKDGSVIKRITETITNIGKSLTNIKL